MRATKRPTILHYQDNLIVGRQHLFIKEKAMATKKSSKKSKASKKTDKKRPQSQRPHTNPAQPTEAEEPKKRAPRMTQKEIWLIYGRIMLATNAEEVFDILAHRFEDHNDLNYWLFRVGQGELKTLRKGHDFVDYLRLAGTRLFRTTRSESV
jgi:hypothetical protein